MSIAIRPQTYRKTDAEAESGGNVQRLERYSSYIPVVGGIMQARYGIDELQAGTPLQSLNGKIDIALGTSATVGQVAMAPLYASYFLRVAAPVLAIAGPVAALAGVVGCVVDGGRDIYNGIKLDTMSDKVVGAVKIGSGLVSAAGAAATVVMGAATANLPLMMAGTIVYGAAAAYQNRAAIGKVIHHALKAL